MTTVTEWVFFVIILWLLCVLLVQKIKYQLLVEDASRLLVDDDFAQEMKEMLKTQREAKP